MQPQDDGNSAMLEGAASREQTFKNLLSEQLILQTYQKNSKDYIENNPDTPAPAGSFEAFFYQKNSLKKYNASPNLMRDMLNVSPLTLPMSEIQFYHKASGSTSQTVTPNLLEGTTSANPQMKSTTFPSQSTQMIQLIKKNESSQLNPSSSIIEDETHFFHLPMSYEEAAEIEEKAHSTSKASPSKNSDAPVFGLRKKLPETSFSGILGAVQQSIPMMNSTIGDNLNDQSNYGMVLKPLTKCELNEIEDLNKNTNDFMQKSEFKTLSKKRSRTNATILSSPQQKLLNGQGGGSDFLKNMRIMKHVRLFMSKLKSFTIYSHFKDLTQKHYEMIGDVSAFFHTRYIPSPTDLTSSYIGRSISGNNSDQKYLKSFRKDTPQYKYKNYKLRRIPDIILHLFKSIPIFDTNSYLFIFWDMFMLLIQIAAFFIIPLLLSFEVDWDFIGSLGGDIQIILIGVFLLDGLITLNRGVYISGAVVMERNVIFQEYKRKILFTDIVTIISLARINKYLQFLIFIRLKYVIIIINRLDDHFQIKMRYPNFMKFVFMISSIILVAHFCACLLYLVSRLSMELGDQKISLLTSEIFLNSNFSTKYINCLYLTLITMSTVGYGDIVPKNNYEKMYTMVMTMISSATFGCVVNTVGEIFSTISQRSASFDQKKFEITTYMNTRGIPKQIQMKAIKYLEYTQLTNRNSHLKGETIVNSLPSQLSQEIKQEFFGKILKTCKILHSNFSEAAINLTAQRMKEISLAPGQFLFQGGQKDQRIYFLLEGNLSVHIEKQNGKLMKIASIQQKNAIIGQRSFFCEQARSKWIKCEQSSNLAYIELQDFKETLLHFPIDYEVFCYMKDTIIFEGKTADTPCASCEKFQHRFQECPLLHLRINKIKLIYTGLYSMPQERQNTSKACRSTLKRKFQSLKENNVVRMKLRKLRVDKIKEQLEELQQEDQQSLTVGLANITSENADNTYEEEIKAYESQLGVKSDRKFFKNVPSIEFSDEEESSDGTQPIPDMIINELKEEDGDDGLDDFDPDFDEKSDETSQQSSVDNKLEISDQNKKIKEQLSKKINASDVSSTGEAEQQQQQMNLKETDKSSAETLNIISASSKLDLLNSCYAKSHLLSKTSQIEDIISEIRGQQQMKQKALTKEEPVINHFQTGSQISINNQPQTENNQINLFGHQKSSSSMKAPNSSLPILPMYKEKDINTLSATKNHNNNTLKGNNVNLPVENTNNSLATAFNSPKNNQNSMINNSTNNENASNTPLNNANLQQILSNEQVLKIIRKALLNPNQKQSSLQSKNTQFLTSCLHKSVLNKSFKQNRQDQTKTGVISSSCATDKLRSLSKQNSSFQNNYGETLQNRQMNQQQIIQNMIKQTQELFFYDFETAKRMVKYYPKQNMLNVIVSYTKVWKMRIRNGRKSILTNDNNQSSPMINQERNSIKIVSPLKRKKERGRERTENFLPMSSQYKNRFKGMSIIQPNNSQN